MIVMHIKLYVIKHIRIKDNYCASSIWVMFLYPIVLYFSLRYPSFLYR